MVCCLQSCTADAAGMPALGLLAAVAKLYRQLLHELPYSCNKHSRNWHGMSFHLHMILEVDALRPVELCRSWTYQRRCHRFCTVHQSFNNYQGSGWKTASELFGKRLRRTQALARGTQSETDTCTFGHFYSVRKAFFAVHTARPFWGSLFQKVKQILELGVGSTRAQAVATHERAVKAQDVVPF